MRKFDTDNIPAILITICVIAFIAIKYFFPELKLHDIIEPDQNLSLEVTIPISELGISNSDEYEEAINTYQFKAEHLAKIDKDDFADITISYVHTFNAEDQISVELKAYKLKPRYRSLIKKVSNDVFSYLLHFQANKKINKDKKQLAFAPSSLILANNFLPVI